VGVSKDCEELKRAWRLGRVFEPRWGADQRDTTFHAWQKAIAAARERIF